MPKVNGSYHPLPRVPLVKALSEYPILTLARTPAVDRCGVLLGGIGWGLAEKRKPPPLARRGLSPVLTDKTTNDQEASV